MTPLIITPPSVEPLTLAQAKAWLRIQHADEDELVAALVVAARQHVERHVRRVLLSQMWRLMYDSWPQGDLVLPVSPVRSVTLRVYPASGPVAVVAPSTYAIADGWTSPILRFITPPPAPGQTQNGVEIDAMVGYGADAASLPAPLVHAIRLLVARFYAQRGDEADDQAAMPPDIAALLAPYRRVRLA